MSATKTHRPPRADARENREKLLGLPLDGLRFGAAVPAGRKG